MSNTNDLFNSVKEVIKSSGPVHEEPKDNYGVRLKELFESDARNNLTKYEVLLARDYFYNDSNQSTLSTNFNFSLRNNCEPKTDAWYDCHDRAKRTLKRLRFDVRMLGEFFELDESYQNSIDYKINFASEIEKSINRSLEFPNNYERVLELESYFEKALKVKKFTLAQRIIEQIDFLKGL